MFDAEVEAVKLVNRETDQFREQCCSDAAGGSIRCAHCAGWMGAINAKPPVSERRSNSVGAHADIQGLLSVSPYTPCSHSRITPRTSYENQKKREIVRDQDPTDACTNVF